MFIFNSISYNGTVKKVALVHFLAKSLMKRSISLTCLFTKAALTLGPVGPGELHVVANLYETRLEEIIALTQT